MEFYRCYTLTDNERKELWKRKIGNKLEISRELYLGLLSRLGTEKFLSSVNRTITKDLMRDIPDQGEGDEESTRMFSTIKRVLRLFVLYRPDIGYIQGMDHIAITLYYYFDEFQVFLLFSNLIVINQVLYNFYTFDHNKVFIILFICRLLLIKKYLTNLLRNSFRILTD